MLQHYQETFKISKNGEGKKVLLIAGMHGNERTPLQSLILFKANHLAKFIEAYHKFNLSEISEITIINGINLYGIRDGIREVADSKTGSNSKDLNRKFVFDKYEETFDPVNTLLAEVEKNDVIIDIHSTPGMMNHVMLLDYGETAFPYIKWCNDTKFLFAIRYSDERTLKRYAIDKGKIGVTLEFNGMEFIDHVSARMGAQNIEDLLMNFRQETFTKKYSGVLRTFVELQSPETGLLVFPHILDYSGKVLCDVTTAQTNFAGNGALLYVNDKGSFVKKGQIAFALQPEVHIQELKEPQPVEVTPKEEPAKEVKGEVA